MKKKMIAQKNEKGIEAIASLNRKSRQSEKEESFFFSTCKQ